MEGPPLVADSFYFYKVRTPWSQGCGNQVRELLRQVTAGWELHCVHNDGLWTKVFEFRPPAEARLQV